MIKTLRITSVIAAILAVVFIVFLAVFGARGDKRVAKLLKSPGAVERFKQAKGATGARAEGQISPLVQQAKAFASYLNPPAKPKPKVPVRPKTGTPAVRPTSPVSAKFELKGTAYYAVRPELSIALIDEPGKGSHWVGQSSKVGHLVIEQIKDGLVVVRDGSRTFELEVKKPQERDITTAATSGDDAEALFRSLVEASADIIKASGAQAPPARETSGKPPTTTAEEQAASMEKMIGELEAMQAAIDTNKPDSNSTAEEDIAFMAKIIKEFEAMQANLKSRKTASGASAEQETAAMEKFISDLESMRISAEEAKKLDDLGKKLNGDAEQEQQEPNRPPPK